MNARHRTAKRPGSQAERGAVAVEFALVLPIFLPAPGIFEFGRAFNIPVSLSEAAREYDTGSGAECRIGAFAHISLRGWNLKGGSRLPGDFTAPEATAHSSSLKLKNSDNGVFGRFIKRLSLVEAATVGGPKTHGALGVQLSK